MKTKSSEDEALKNIFEVGLTFNLADLLDMPLNDTQRKVAGDLVAQYVISEDNMKRIKHFVESNWPSAL